MAIRRSSIFFVFIFIGFIACESNNTIFDTYKTLDSASWSAKDTIKFDFQVSDTISRNNLFINLRNNNQYGYSNIYVITNLYFPDGKKVVDTLQYAMTDSEGNFLGSGFSEIKENKLYYKEQKVFPMSGMYRVSIRQAMRKNGEIDPIQELEGISDVGFRIEKIE